MTLLEIARLTEEQAREYLERLRWPSGPVCPHCGSQNVTRLAGESARPGTIQCNECREQFTVTVGSVMESSKVPLVKWIMGFHLLCSSKKGISALQLQRELGLGSYRTAWFMAHRIRHAMETDTSLFSGTVEVDETYVGGKPRYKGQSKRGRGTKKTPVMVLVERDGGAHARPLDAVDSGSLKDTVRELVDPSATLMTDEFPAYAGLDSEFKGGHHTVNHGKKEYVRKSASGDVFVTTNTAESFFSLMKRGHYGVYHQLSRKHIHRYCHEYSFRWTHRKVTDGERTEAAIRGAGGKRLRYKTPA